MKSKSDYAEMYKSRTEEIKKVIRSDDQNTTDYKLYNEAVLRATEDKRSDVLVMRWMYEILACAALILIPSFLIGYIAGETNIGFGVGALLFLTLMGIRGMMLASIVGLPDHLMIGNPYGNGKIPNTKNLYLQEYINEYKVKAQTVFVELKKDEENALDAIAYDEAAADSIEDIDVFRPFMISIVSMIAIVPLMVLFGLVLPSGLAKELIEVIVSGTLFCGAMIYLLVVYPLRMDIRTMIRRNNPYRTEE